ncbi:SNF2 domain-containing protein CLASSY 1-like [Typha angustifolia]|uniref:SNF2 domain-containing protein CLASSY 1-like n=1 Tax=Typha angustifolia TaxID=59011 RepID=UPI003C2B431A
MPRKHPIGATPFEAFYHGSWHGVDYLSIRSGSIFVQFKYHGTVVDYNIHGDCLRMRSRRADVIDCTQLLRPGVDVCALLAHRAAASSEQERQAPKLLWHDAKIISIKRIPHGDRCDCLFSIIFYRNESPISMKKSVADRRARIVTLDNIAVLQRLQKEASEDGYHQWNSTEDCISSIKSKLLSDTFSSEISWLLVLSTLKGVDFGIKLVQDKVVYHILDNELGPAAILDVQSDCHGDNVSPNYKETMKIVIFQLHDETMHPKIEALTLMASKEMAIQNKNFEEGLIDTKSESESDVEILYDQMNLRHSKRQKILPDRFTSYSSPNFDRCSTKKMVDDLSIEKLETPENNLESGLPINENLTPLEMQYMIMVEGQTLELHLQNRPTGSKKVPNGSCRQPQTGSSFSHRSHYFSAQAYRRKYSNKKKLLSETEFKKMIDTCVGNIKSEINRQNEPTIQKKANAPTGDSEEAEDFTWSPSTEDHVEIEEHEELWKEMEHSLTTLTLLEQNQIFESELCSETSINSEKNGEQPCQHDYRMNEEAGIVCRLCNFVCTEIRYVSPPVLHGDGRFSYKGRVDTRAFWYPDLQIDPFHNVTSPWDISQEECRRNIWTSIPDLKLKLHPHQKTAFEFIWSNITGSLEPEGMNHQSENTGGCVISHSPGSGKTLLMISFINSYLSLYPKTRPLVLTPKTALYTWRKEFQKWGVPIPLYLINQDESYEMEPQDCRIREFSSVSRRPNRRMLKIMNSLGKLRQWHEHPSVLLMTYSSFLSLSREDSKLEYTTVLANVLQNSPGLLILDEGHNPRSTRSKLRKLLMKVKTEFRILLSGTLFQNNFEEYFNTISLARPRFIHDVISELDPRKTNTSSRRKRKEKQSKRVCRKERLARKLFVERIGQKIESSEEDERKQGFDLLKSVTSRFIDVYEGEKSSTLPGLQIYTLALVPTDIQQEILSKLQRVVTHKRYPLELELLITVGSIHPWLIKSVACVSNFFSNEELEKINNYKGNFQSGSKVKFVIDLVHKSTIRGERVLVFCHNLSPIKLLVELFELVFGWHRGEEVLVLQGEQELSVRAKVMDSFNGDFEGKRKVLLASTNACAEGISLTAASRLVMLDSEWNHSKTRQAIARAFRPGQERVVYVYLLLASGTWEEDKYESNLRKAWMSKMIFRGQSINYSTCRQVEHISDELLKELVDEDQTKTFHMITKHD